VEAEARVWGRKDIAGADTLDAADGKYAI
jgi:hypothetical protein